MGVKLIVDNEEDDNKGTEGGADGNIGFKWDIGGDTRRDDALPAGEARRLLLAHQELHKGFVEKQKHDRDAYKEKRSGQKNVSSYQTGKGFGMGGGGIQSPYKAHPISAKFSGRDKQVIGVPGLEQAKTNEEARSEVEQRLENRLAHTHQPTFNPRPKGPYG